MKGMIFVDIKKCLACKTCEFQCAVVHSKSKDLYQAIDEYPLPQRRVKVESVAELTIPLQCRQCEDAPCVKICPTKAIEKSEVEQPVLIKEQLCIGCKWCILVCPFGVIGMDREGKAVIKCDLCFERLKDDKLPACVEACPTKALQFKTSEEVASEKRKEYLVKFAKGKEMV